MKAKRNYGGQRRERLLFFFTPFRVSVFSFVFLLGFVLFIFPPPPPPPFPFLVNLAGRVRDLWQRDLLPTPNESSKIGGFFFGLIPRGGIYLVQRGIKKTKGEGGRDGGGRLRSLDSASTLLRL
ncbi:hypothetical protein LX32DRAFT_71228 [Colletotrichum zoysiae]|uniref:Transmembrane protein n=1 Tax=Colletotrichum zoysiae TaxID=1216348 RepID=A0AAD9LY21_9PEZI|nr:hypothetical protein LX32DRAFT_71228 [Colletotrichum zoysiae]